MKYTIYKTANDIDGKFYIGKHQTNNPNDSYLGSGVHLERAIKKYGRSHFHKEVLFVFDTENEMNEKEKELITPDLIRDPSCYNMALGGEGGDTWSLSGRHHSDRTREKLRVLALRQSKDPEVVKARTDALRRWFKDMKDNHHDAYQDFLRRRAKKLVESRKHRHGGSQFSEETRKKLSEAAKKYYDKVGRKRPVRAKRELHCSGTPSGRRVSITNGMVELRVFTEELEWYLSNGWGMGRKPNTKRPSEQSKNNSSGKGMLIVHNKEARLVKRIKPDELNQYLSVGWVRGYLNRKNRLV